MHSYYYTPSRSDMSSCPITSDMRILSTTSRSHAVKFRDLDVGKYSLVRSALDFCLPFIILTDLEVGTRPSVELKSSPSLLLVKLFLLIAAFRRLGLWISERGGYFWFIYIAIAACTQESATTHNQLGLMLPMAYFTISLGSYGY